MKKHLKLVSVCLTAGLLWSNLVLSQDPVQIQFLKDPVLVQTGTEIVFTVVTVPQVLSMTWQYQGDVTLGIWSGGSPVIDTVPQFEGRVTITSTQLRIGGAQLRDAGNYSVTVIPSFSTGLVQNSRSIQLRVFDAVGGVSVQVPLVAMESKNVSLKCVWTAGTETLVQWKKGGAAVLPDSRITITDEGDLVINPGQRSDTGDYICTVSNLVSAQSATKTLTVYYGPDVPVLTKDSPKDCVGDGDVQVGENIRLTCMSDSLPPALFTWQRDGQTLVSDQPDSGVLNVQTLSTEESGRYVCTARNGITQGTSEEDTVLTVVETCLSGGEVAGIVIAALVLILIIALLVTLIVFVCRRRRRRSRRNEYSRQRDAVFVPKTEPKPETGPPGRQPNGTRNSNRGLNPPLHSTAAPAGRHLYDNPAQNQQLLQLNSLTPHHTPVHSNAQRWDADPPLGGGGGVDNPAFTHAHQLQNTHQQPDSHSRLQSTGNAQSRNLQAQQLQAPPPPAAVQLSLNTHNGSNQQVPTIHVNLNSFPSVAAQTQDPSFAPNNTQIQTQGWSHPGDTGPTGPSGPSGPRVRGQPGLIPTGYTHFNPNHVSQQNAVTQTYEQDSPRNRRSSRGDFEETPGSTHRQMPWDLLRGTPSYPSGTLQRRQLPPEVTWDSTDYPSRPAPQGRRSQSRTRDRSSSPGATPSQNRHDRSHSAGGHGETRSEGLRSSHTDGQNDQRDFRRPSGGLIVPKLEPARIQSHPVTSLEVTSQAPSGRGDTDARALVDPNHLPQMPQTQNPQLMGSVPLSTGTALPAGTSTVQQGPAQPVQINLTQAALRAHTDRARTFQSRRQQTQAALLSPGPQSRTPAPVTAAPGAGPQRPPTPPPVMPFSDFQHLPKERTRQPSPNRAPPAPRPPVNVPLSQRNLQVQRQRQLGHVPQNHQHHHHRHPAGHVHVSPQRHGHAHPHHQGNRRPAHPSNPRQPQDPRGRPR